MSEQYKRSQSASDGMAEAPFSGLGRGTGMTLKEMKRLMDAALKRRGIGSQRHLLQRSFAPNCKGIAGVRTAPSLPVAASPENWKDKLKRIVGGQRPKLN